MDSYVSEEAFYPTASPSPGATSSLGSAPHSAGISPALVMAAAGSISPESTVESPAANDYDNALMADDGPQYTYGATGVPPGEQYAPMHSSSPDLKSVRPMRSASTPSSRQHLHLSLPPKYGSAQPPSLSPMFISAPTYSPDPRNLAFASPSSGGVSPASSSASHFAYPVFSSPITSSTSRYVDADSAATSPQMSSPSYQLPRNLSTPGLKRSSSCNQPGYVPIPLEGENLAELPPKSVQSGAGAFVYKVYNMLLDTAFQHLISWSATGDSFIISNQTEFSAEVLPKHFKHNNFSSFVRQLNMYGFHKVNKTPRGSKGTEASMMWHFSHQQFLRGRTDLLDTIKRKTTTDVSDIYARPIPATPVSPVPPHSASSSSTLTRAAAAAQHQQAQAQATAQAAQIQQQHYLMQRSLQQQAEMQQAARRGGGNGGPGMQSPHLVSPAPQMHPTTMQEHQQAREDQATMRQVEHLRETCRTLQMALTESRQNEVMLGDLVARMGQAMRDAGVHFDYEAAIRPPDAIEEDVKPSILVSPAVGGGPGDFLPSPSLTGYDGQHYGGYRSPSALSSSSYGGGGTFPPSRRNSTQSVSSMGLPEGGAPMTTTVSWGYGFAQAVTTPLPPSPAPPGPPVGLGVEMSGSGHSGSDEAISTGFIAPSKVFSSP